MVRQQKKIIKEGDLVTFDFGAIYNGYHSDITRTVAVGSISEQKRYIYDAVLGCNEYIETLLKAGVICSDMDREARNYLKKNLSLILISFMRSDIV